MQEEQEEEKEEVKEEYQEEIDNIQREKKIAQGLYQQEVNQNQEFLERNEKQLKRIDEKRPTTKDQVRVPSIVAAYQNK